MPAGQTTGVITIEVVNDALPENTETFTVCCTDRPRPGASCQATGKIIDDDAQVAKAWLARFGRTVATHVTDAIEERLTGQIGQTSQATVAGRRVPAPTPAAGVEPQAYAVIPYRTLDPQDLLSGSSFLLAAAAGGDESAPGEAWTVWGRGAVTELAGRDDEVSVGGEVGTATVGVDYDWDRVLAGLALAYTGGEADYSVTGAAARTGRAGSWMISAHPYARVHVTDEVQAWGVLGYGLGGLTMQERKRSDPTDIRMMMAGLGARAEIAAPDTDRFGLAVKTDGFLTRTNASDVSAAQADAHRARLVAEGSYQLDFGPGGVLTPVLETGVRYDFGDAETGFGAELGGRLRYAYPAWGLTVAANARVLLAHQDLDAREWGAGGSLLLNPDPSGLGLSLALNSVLGSNASGVQRLWSQGAAANLAVADPAAPAHRFDAQLGYGLSAFGGTALVTPYAGLALGDAGSRAYRLGSRFTVAPSFSLSLEGQRRETDGATPSHGVTLGGSLRW